MSARKLKVVTVSALAGTVGGGERIASDVTRRLDPERFERLLCITRWNVHETASQSGIPEFLAEQERAGVRVLRLNRESRLDARPWLPLLRELRTADVLHTHMFGANVAGAVLSAATRVPVFVAHEHTWSFEGKPLRRLLDRHLIARASDAFIAVSREDERRMIAIEKIKPSQVRFVPNGVSVKPASRSPEQVRMALELEPDAQVIGAIGVLRPQKRFDSLIRAAALLRDRHPGVKVLIAGPGRERPGLEALIAELGVGDTVRLLGQRTDVPDILSVLDVGAVSSDFEGSPLALMEMMGAGVPVVATAVGGIPDLIEDGLHGILVPPGDHEALARALSDLLSDPAARARMGEAARLRQQNEFDIDVMTRRIENLYEELYERRRGV